MVRLQCAAALLQRSGTVVAGLVYSLEKLLVRNSLRKRARRFFVLPQKSHVLFSVEYYSCSQATLAI